MRRLLTEAAAALFGPDDERRKRLAVNPRR
jgi:hypothetical protein